MFPCELLIDSNHFLLIDKQNNINEKITLFSNSLNINKLLSKHNLSPETLFINIISVKENFNLIFQLNKNLKTISFFTNDIKKIVAFNIKIENPKRLRYDNLFFKFFNNIHNKIKNSKLILDKIKNLEINNSFVEKDFLGNYEFNRLILEKITSKTYLTFSNINLLKIKDSNFKSLKINKLNKLEINKSIINNLQIVETNKLSIKNSNINKLSSFRINELTLLKTFIKKVDICSKILNIDIKTLFEKSNILNTNGVDTVVLYIENIKQLNKLEKLWGKIENNQIYFQQFEASNFLLDNKIQKNSKKCEILKKFIFEYNKIKTNYKNKNDLIFKMVLKKFVYQFLSLGINFNFIKNDLLNNISKI